VKLLGKDNDNIEELSEILSRPDRDYIIKKAATLGQVTLSTRVFGRGTDFFSRDQILEKKGGVHVIQTFLSDLKSEEVQIKGRTARQGQSGSYGMVLLLKDELIEGLSKEDSLQKYDINHDDIDLGPRNEWYQNLCEKRNNYHLQRMQSANDHILLAKERQDMTEEILKLLKDGSIDEAKSKFRILYKNIKGDPSKISKTICLLDSTGSMFWLWNSVKNTIKSMISRLTTIAGEDNFKIKFIAYRDYVARTLTVKSEWSNNASYLKAFVIGVGLRDGGADGGEAVEIALQEVVEEHDSGELVTQAILIGDECPHLEGKGNRIKRARLFFKGHRLETDYKVESRRLAERGIPVHTFYIQDTCNNLHNLRTSFTEISTITSGRASKLLSSEHLTDIICTQILKDVGGEDMVAEYRERYGEEKDWCK